jgi:hypothetical protein
MATTTELLVGSWNFIEWDRSFIRAAKDKDVYDLLTGKYIPPKVEPRVDEAQTTAVNININLNRPSLIPSSSELCVSLEGETELPNVQKLTINLTNNIVFARFQHDHAQWEKGQEKIKIARRLIDDTISPMVAEIVENEDDPVEAYKVLHEEYKPDKDAAHEMLIRKLKENAAIHHVSGGASAAKLYLSGIFDVRRMFKHYGHKIDDEEIADFILDALPNTVISTNFRTEYKATMALQGYPEDHDLGYLVEQIMAWASSLWKPRYGPRRTTS